MIVPQVDKIDLRIDRRRRIFDSSLSRWRPLRHAEKCHHLVSEHKAFMQHLRTCSWFMVNSYSFLKQCSQKLWTGIGLGVGCFCARPHAMFLILTINFAKPSSSRSTHNNSLSCIFGVYQGLGSLNYLPLGSLLGSDWKFSDGRIINDQPRSLPLMPQCPNECMNKQAYDCAL